MLTFEEVALAYRLYLGREPENADVVNNLCQTVHTIRELRAAFMESPEFRKLMGEELDKQQQIRHRHPFTFPHIPVESDVSDEVLSRMFDRIHEEWSSLGVSEPYWSVITQPQFYRTDFEENRKQFLTSGKSVCTVFLSALRRNGINPNLLETCLELGCGVGRVTAALAQNFKQVIAVDISQPHIELAKEILAQENIHNVEFQQWRNMGNLYQIPAVDAIFTVITLQHNPPPIIAWTLRALLYSLKPSGIAYFQIPTYKNGYLFEAERYLDTQMPKDFEMHFLPQKDIFKIIAGEHCALLEVREDPMVGEENVMLSNTFLVQKNA